MATILDTIRGFLESKEDDYVVAGYVLERREPDPKPKVATYDDPVTPDDVVADGELQSGIYLLQELKPSGMAGEVLWEEELTFEE